MVKWRLYSIYLIPIPLGTAQCTREFPLDEKYAHDERIGGGSYGDVHIYKRTCDDDDSIDLPTKIAVKMFKELRCVYVGIPSSTVCPISGRMI